MCQLCIVYTTMEILPFPTIFHKTGQQVFTNAARFDTLFSKQNNSGFCDITQKLICKGKHLYKFADAVLDAFGV